MEQNNILFDTGIHRSPSVAQQDGELSECVNLIPHNGELVNVRPPIPLDVKLPDGAVLLCTHDVDNETNYVYKIENGDGSTCKIGYAKKTGVYENITDSVDDVKSLSIIGKCLCCVTEVGIFYFLWNSKSKAYGIKTSLPDLDIDIKLTGGMESLTFANSIAFRHSDDRSQADKYNIPVRTFNAQELHDFWIDITGHVRPDGPWDACEDITDLPFKTLALDATDITYSRYFPEELELGKTYCLKGVGDGNLYVRTADIGWKMIYNNANGQDGFIFTYTENTRFIAVDFQASDITMGLGFFEKEKSELGTGGDSGYSLNTKNDSGANNDPTDFNAAKGDLLAFSDVCMKKKKFIYPFFIRYALRFYNGELTRMSEPILLIPNNGGTPFLVADINHAWNGDESRGFKVTAVANCCDIVFKLLNREAFDDWVGVITGISFAITQPIYRFDQSVEFDPQVERMPVFKKLPENLSNHWGILNKTKTNIFSSVRDKVVGNYVIFPPMFNDEGYKEHHTDSHIFYRIKDYTFNELKLRGDDHIKLDVSKVNLQALGTLPVMTDDYNSRNKLIPAGSFTYNNRLTLFNIKEIITHPLCPASPVTSGNNRYKFIFIICNYGKGYTVSREYASMGDLLYWLYFPDINCTECVIIRSKNGISSYISVSMSVHPFMSGAYALLDESSLAWKEGDPSDEYEHTGDNVVDHPNAIYASSLNNPFHFPVLTQTTVGTGTIRAVSTSAKALSQGQFGQFPLFAFSTDGIWALSVDDQGRYASSNPINRDVVINVKSICQIDSAVVYADSQGLKLISGSDTQLLSDVMNGRNVDESHFFNDVDTAHAGLVKADSDSLINLLKDASVLYDNAGHSWLHIYPANCKTTGKHLVYSLDDNAWTTVVDDTSKVETLVPGYPFSTIQKQDGTLMQFTNKEDNDTVRYGVLLTRELAFGDPFAMKLLADMRMHYTKYNEDHPASCKVAVFVSNDRRNWRRLSSLRAHSYKWYRFRIVTSLTDLDALVSLSCRYEYRRTNKLR